MVLHKAINAVLLIAVQDQQVARPREKALSTSGRAVLAWLYARYGEHRGPEMGRVQSG